MTNLEENNLFTQITLMENIISNHSSIFNAATIIGEKLRVLLSTKIIEKDNITVTLNKETVDDMLRLVYILQDKERWGEINSSAQSAISENRIKKEILESLQK